MFLNSSDLTKNSQSAVEIIHPKKMPKNRADIAPRQAIKKSVLVTKLKLNAVMFCNKLTKSRI